MASKHWKSVSQFISAMQVRSSPETLRPYVLYFFTWRIHKKEWSAPMVNVGLGLWIYVATCMTVCAHVQTVPAGNSRLMHELCCLISHPCIPPCVYTCTHHVAGHPLAIPHQLMLTLASCTGRNWPNERRSLIALACKTTSSVYYTCGTTCVYIRQYMHAQCHMCMYKCLS